MSWTLPRTVNHILTEKHYLGPLNRGVAWHDEYGVIIVSAPTARLIPGHWLELARWCITSSVKNAGSRQWAAFYRALRRARPDVTTVVSYSDPSVGHTGALYRACNWLYAPTWHRLRKPPSGGGSWDGVKVQTPKDRWVYPLRRDPERVAVLLMRDCALLRKYEWARYVEPRGVPFKRLAEVA